MRLITIICLFTLVVAGNSMPTAAANSAAESTSITPPAAADVSLKPRTFDLIADYVLDYYLGPTHDYEPIMRPPYLYPYPARPYPPIMG